jgi:glycerophosphoryl diester phosphodiesterase
MKKSFYILIPLIVISSCKKEVIIYYEDNNIVAHRGAWKDGHCPQNSLASLRKAIEMKCVGSEFDVWLTKDDSLVVIHDPKYAGKYIEKSTYASLAQTKLSNGETLPTLRQYLHAAAGQDQTKLFVELKSLSNDARKLDKITDHIIDAVNEMQMQDHVIYTSFYYYIVQRVHQQLPSAKTLFLGGTSSPDKISSDGISGIAYDIDSFYNHTDWVVSAQTDDLILTAWTVNNDREYSWLLNNKFDYVFTDEPKSLFRALDKTR